VHARGIVCKGTFTPTREAAALSRAVHFQAPVPVTVRYSDGAPDPGVAENSPDSSPRGMAIRFHLPGGDTSDIVSLSHNGFVVGTGEEFLELQKAVVATDPSKPHPWPIEQFLGARPLALKFVQEIRTVPVSFATESFFGNNAFLFVNREGAKQAGRYHILPVAGQQNLSEADAKTKSAGHLSEELGTRLASGPAQFRLFVQLANPGDATKDSSAVWPSDRKMVEAGIISVEAVVPDSPGAERALSFAPTNIRDGIELSDDPLPTLRSDVYALSVKFRQKK
jgi:catalase